VELEGKKLNDPSYFAKTVTRRRDSEIPSVIPANIEQDSNADQSFLALIRDLLIYKFENRPTPQEYLDLTRTSARHTPVVLAGFK
jgi:hypothetical protein